MRKKEKRERGEEAREDEENIDYHHGWHQGRSTDNKTKRKKDVPLRKPSFRPTQQDNKTNKQHTTNTTTHQRHQQHNTTHNTTQHNTTQHNTTQHKQTVQHNNTTERDWGLSRWSELCTVTQGLGSQVSAFVRWTVLNPFVGLCLSF